MSRQEPDTTAGQPAGRDYVFLLFSLIAVQSLALAITAFTHNVNWDEFHFLQLVHEFSRGESVRALQTFHVRLFSWIVALPVTDLTQVFAGRVIAFVLVLGTATLTGFLAYSLMRQSFMGESDDTKASLAGLLAVAAFLTSGFMTIHAASFRADPLVAFLLMAALTVLFICKTSSLWLSLAVLSTSLALVISVKATLWMPAFVGVLIWRGKDPGVAFRMMLAGLLVLPVAGAIYWAHSLGLNAEHAERSASSLSDALFTGLLNSGFMPRLMTLQGWMLYSLPALAGVLIAFSTLRIRSDIRDRARARLVLFLMVAPALSVLIYRNAFPYFFPFITPPLMAVAGIGLVQLSSRIVRILVLLAMTMAIAGQGIRSAGESNDSQRMTIDALRRMFPAPVAYIERSAALPDYQKVGPFLSGWGLQKYRDAGVPVFTALIRDRQPPFVLATSPALLAALDGRHSTNSGLLPEDQAALSQSYVHFSGPVWLAGKRIFVGPEPKTTTFWIAGHYRLHSEVAVIINGHRFIPGEAMDIAPGSLTLATGTDQEAVVTLILDVPEEERKNFPDGAFYAEL